MMPNWRQPWEDGMMLSAKHFTTLETHMQNHALSLVRAIQPYYWGFMDYKIDTEALTQGTIRLTQAAGLFKNGGVFTITEPLELHIQSTNERNTIYLECTDDFDCNEESLIKAKLILTTYEQPQRQQLPIAQISTINSTLAVSLSASFIPPILNIERCRPIRVPLTHLSIYDPICGHQHPFEAHKYIMQKAIQLNIQERLHAYDHDQLEQSLLTNIKLIQQYLDNQSTSYHGYSMTYNGHYWSTQINALKKTSTLIIGLPISVNQSDHPVTIAPNSVIQSIIRHLTNGMELKPALPAPDIGQTTPLTLYELQQDSELWNTLLEEQHIAIHMPHSITQAEPKLWIR
ncbi:MAG: hypothetical protein COB66_00900 [Coxiella sp. (in: Bacteria)]|nr:MAG: hypothetical protein COB66_00900 [Coxiella sp. (in: g-proteobacteria)]